MLSQKYVTHVEVKKNKKMYFFYSIHVIQTYFYKVHPPLLRNFGDSWCEGTKSSVAYIFFLVCPGTLNFSLKLRVSPYLFSNSTTGHKS